MKYANSINIFILILLFYSTISFSKENNSDFFIPNTVSEKAKLVLKTFNKKYRSIKDLPDNNDIEGWKTLKNRYIRYTENINTKALKEFRPKIEYISISGVAVAKITPKTWSRDKKIIIYLHGGAYTLFTSESSLYNIIPVAHSSGIRVISINYTTAPRKKWKEILKEVTKVIIQLNKDGYSYESMGVLGDSAGGGLAVSSILKLRNDGHNIPKAVVLWSPWVDVTETGDTYQTLKDAEPTFTYNSLLVHSANAYADIKDQKNPYVSPIYGNFKKGFPTTLIQGGTKEILLSNFVRIYQKMDISGVNVKLDIYEGMWHVFQSHYNISESKIAIKKTANFFNTNLIP